MLWLSAQGLGPAAAKGFSRVRAVVVYTWNNAWDERGCIGVVHAAYCAHVYSCVYGASS